MSFVIATVRIEDFGAGTLGVKEALAMRLEPLGGVRVLRVEVREEEQVSMEFDARAKEDKRGMS